MKKVKLISTLFDKLAGFFIKFKMTEKNGHRLIGVNCAWLRYFLIAVAYDERYKIQLLQNDISYFGVFSKS